MRGEGLGVHAQLRFTDFRTLVGIQGHRKAWLWRVFPIRPVGSQRALPLSPPCGIGHTTSGRLCFLEASPIPPTDWSAKITATTIWEPRLAASPLPAESPPL
uniref:Uncharacterized protein n=1 Tax=Morchella importuna TaxID=1174673 RepID=A0A650AF69_9PEZI|nr:hypothetical protein [Morchella importuna]QGN66676.1 hypothetical protein [Morchella importuna]